MGRRLYYGELMRAIKYWAGYEGHPAEFVLQYVDENRHLTNYRGETPEAIIQQMKADGRVIWGKDFTDYSCPPRNAFEYKLLEAYFKSQGHTDAEIAQWFSLESEATDE